MIKTAKPDPLNHQADQLRSTSRPAARHRENHVKKLQCIGRTQNQDRGQPGDEEGKLDIPQYRPPITGLQTGSLLHLYRHHRQSGQQYETAKRRPLPDVQETDGDKCVIRISDPVDGGESEEADKLIDNAVLDVEGDLPEQADDSIGRRHWNHQTQSCQGAEH